MMSVAIMRLCNCNRFKDSQTSSWSHGLLQDGPLVLSHVTLPCVNADAHVAIQPRAATHGTPAGNPTHVCLGIRFVPAPMGNSAWRPGPVYNIDMGIHAAVVADQTH